MKRCARYMALTCAMTITPCIYCLWAPHEQGKDPLTGKHLEEIRQKNVIQPSTQNVHQKDALTPVNDQRQRIGRKRRRQSTNAK